MMVVAWLWHFDLCLIITVFTILVLFSCIIMFVGSSIYNII